MITGFHHIAINTTDIERSARFYREVLGFREKMRLDYEGGGYLLMLELGGVSVGLFAGGKPSDLEARSGEVGYVHLALSVDDVDAEYERIQAAGYEFYVAPKTVQNLRIAFFRDPDGIPIELMQEL
jgi:glyoxylase I family protein